MSILFTDRAVPLTDATDWNGLLTIVTSFVERDGMLCSETGKRIYKYMMDEATQVSNFMLDADFGDLRNVGAEVIRYFLKKNQRVKTYNPLIVFQGMPGDATLFCGTGNELADIIESLNNCDCYQKVLAIMAWYYIGCEFGMQMVVQLEAVEEEEEEDGGDQMEIDEGVDGDLQRAGGGPRAPRPAPAAPAAPPPPDPAVALRLQQEQQQLQQDRAALQAATAAAAVEQQRLLTQRAALQAANAATAAEQQRRATEIQRQAAAVATQQAALERARAAATEDQQRATRELAAAQEAEAQAEQRRQQLLAETTTARAEQQRNQEIMDGVAEQRRQLDDTTAAVRAERTALLTAQQANQQAAEEATAERRRLEAMRRSTMQIYIVIA